MERDFHDIDIDLEKSLKSLEKKIKGMLKKVSPNASLRELLSSQTKEQLMTRCAMFGIAADRRLKKQELIELFASEIGVKYVRTLELMTIKQIDLLESLMKGGGVVETDYDIGSLEEVLTCLDMERTMLVFSGLKDDNSPRLINVLPNELILALMSVDFKEKNKSASRNEEWVALAGGMASRYGVISVDDCAMEITRLTGKTIDKELLCDVLMFAMQSNVSFFIEGELVVGLGVFDPYEVREEQLSRAELPYRRFSKKELLSSQSSLPLSVKNGWSEFANYLVAQKGYDAEDAEMIVDDIQDIMAGGFSIGALMEYMSREAEIEFDSVEDANRMMGMIMKLHNDQPQWALKGHSPNEVFERYERPNLGKIPHAMGQVAGNPSNGAPTTGAKIIAFSSAKAAGGNEPCPCGSGKKFKSCCMNKHGD